MRTTPPIDPPRNCPASVPSQSCDSVSGGREAVHTRCIDEDCEARDRREAVETEELGRSNWEEGEEPRPRESV